MTNIYQDGSYLENNPLWHQLDSPWKASQIQKMISKNLLSPASICEIGCGAGEILSQLENNYGLDKKFYGYELSPQAYALCQKKTKQNLNFFQGSLLEDDDAHYDLVMAIDVFEHVEDYLGFLRKLKTKGEYKIFHIPLDISVQTVLRCSPIMKRRALVGHIHYFTKETALASLKDTGYEVVDCFYTGGSINLPNKGWKTKLMRIPRRICYFLNQDMAVRILGGFSLMVLAR